MKLLFSFVFVVFHSIVFAATYYVSPTGTDTNNGSLAFPFKTVTKAISSAVAGDIIYLRGGTHVYTTRINISKNGTSANRFYLLAYPGDARPVLDFSGMAINSSNRGIDISGSYWYFKGFDIYKAGDNGMFISGAFNVVDFCSFYENADTGLQLANGANNNQIINCDSYFNKDVTDGNADGYAAKLDVGTGNSFKGCRAWQNSDDGWDGLLTTGLGTNPSTTYDSCWCFMNGYLKTGVASVGNGNGFKVGGNNERHDAILTRCLSAFNRVKGFDQNNNNGSMILYNCTGYKNKPNFGMNNNDPDAGKVMIVKNSISYAGLSADVFRTVCVRTNNSWQISGFTVSNADFLSVDSIGLRNPRNANGTLPIINFMQLATGRTMVNAGVDVGLPYSGTAPDLGAFETAAVVPVSLLFFNGAIKNNQILLTWGTASELNNNGWDIERVNLNNANPFVWQKIGFVVGNKQSNAVVNYTFSDKDVLQGNTYQYRLKQMDADGSVQYSKVLTIKVANRKNEDAVFIYPNPVKNVANVQFTVSKAGNVKLLVFNANGQLVATEANAFYNAGVYNTQIILTKLPAGKYMVQLITKEETTSKEIIKVN
ncbi:MAG: T9SS type A sorting domain-containing protein [Bacteroidia bacterium]|nr:T9SS type A sorting domain-containing protein [Bacteroidia bacterium]